MSAGPARTITLPAQASLQGTATDDGLPNPPGALTLLWTKISGPGTVSFGNASAAVTTASFSAAGTYVLRLTANDSALSASADVTVTVNDAVVGSLAIAAIADRTIVAGSRLQAVIEATSPTVDVLSYSLPGAPAGAGLRPAPLIDWVPTLGQVGTHAITAQVTDGGGRTATTSFNVTVTAPANTPPVLGPQVDQTLAVGSPFTRTLSAFDPDAGDTLTYSLESGPAGMTLSDTTVAWSTSGSAAGDYAVTVRVTDSSGAYDQKTFTVTLQASAVPVAKDDTYSIGAGATLTVSAPGVLGNDSYPGSDALAASLITDPDKGSLSAFNADGSFTYVAPGSIPAYPSLTPTALWGALIPDNTNFGWAADINHDGGADLIGNSFGTPIAFDGKTGAKLWHGWDTSATSLGRTCKMYLFGTDFAVGDVDDTDEITLVMGTECDGSTLGADSKRLIAIDTNPAHAVGGAARVKWVSERLDQKLPVPPSVGAEPVPTYVADWGLVSWATPTLARLTPSGGVKILTRYLVTSTAYWYDSDGDGWPDKYAACRAATGNPVDEGNACKVTLIVDAATGAKEAVLTAPNPRNDWETAQRQPMRQSAPVVADLDGDGQVEIISGTDVFKHVDGQWTLAWQVVDYGDRLLYDPISVSVADLDGDGKAEVILQAMWVQNSANFSGFLIYRHDGTLLRAFPVQTSSLGMPTIADIDGDGAPEIVFAARGVVYAYRPDGTILWANVVPDDDPALHPQDDPAVQHWPSAVGNRTNGGSSVQVYDLDLDGAPEVIVNGTYRLVIFEGRTGTVKTSVHNNAVSANVTTPMIVDTDGDGHAEIVSMPGGTGVCGGCPPINIQPFAGENRDWASAPRIHNQVSYNPWAIDDAGKISYDGAVRRSFRAQRQLGAVVDPRSRDTASFTYAATAGGGTSAPATVRVQIVPQNRPPVITSTPPTAVSTGIGPYPLLAYTLAAYDPDPGDTVQYELVYTSLSAPAAVDPVTGRMTLSVIASGDYGVNFFIVAAVDSQGARATQSFSLDLSAQIRTVPNVVGQGVEPASAAATAVQLTPRVAEVFDTHPVGQVIAQNPAGGTLLVRGGTVLLTVSKGPAPATMPFVVGKPIVAAAQALTNLGIDFTVDPIASSSVPAGEVMTQAPAFGALVTPGVDGPATLGVSAGPPLVKPIASIAVEPGETTRLVADNLGYRATAVFTDGTSTDVTLRAAWNSSLPAVASVDVTGRAKGLTAGDTVISAVLLGKSGSAPLHIKTHVADATDPLAAITSPAEGAVLDGPVSIIGTANDANFLRYELAYALASDDDFTLLSEGDAPVVGGTLASFDPTVLANDQYRIRLTVYDRAGNANIAEVSVTVKGNRKIGPFSLTFTDLNVPMSGIPITISRVYDSRDKARGDFGIGWRMGMSTLRVRTSRVPGTGWMRTVSGPTVSLAPTAEHKVTVTLADGKIEEFDMVFSPLSNLGSLDATRLVGMAPRPGTLGTLQALGNTDLLILDDGAETVLVDDSTLDDFNPRKYRYTTLDGTVIDLDRIDGVTRVADRNGNTLSFGPNGVTHSSGKSVSFVRDAQGRIVQIVDPLGNVQGYAYDGNGDLVARTDAAGLTSTYTYDRRHNLLDAIDPAGNRALRNNYDDSGRLVSTTDADGNTTTYAHDIGTSSEIVTDRLGRPTRYQYDAAGNIVARTDALGGTSTFTYDADGFLLTETDPLGRVSSRTYDAKHNVLSSTDFEGNTRTWTYDAAGLVLTATSATGKVTTNAYDANGNLRSVTSPEGHVTQHGYDAQGRRTSTTDPLGKVTLFTYDASGNTTSVRDPLGNVVTYTYDAAGRQVSATDALGNVTTRTYDPAGRVIKATDAAGSVTTFTYAATGDGSKVATRTDPLGRVTRFDYDALSRLVQTTHPDATTDRMSYDAENRLLSETDRLGKVRQQAFDALGRETVTTQPDGSTLTRAYDAAGRLTRLTDALGNVTTYAYAPRRQTVTDPLGKSTVHDYDGDGRRVSMTDALGHVTATAYDSSGNITRTTYADGSQRDFAYDAAGRLVSETDPLGNVTARTYDAAGKLLTVTDPLGHVTSYAHDAGGRRIRETDANGHATVLAYDALGRLVSRTRPAGNIETMAYDAVGNLVGKTDFEGRTTSFGYDVMNREVSRTLPGGATIVTQYDAAGRRTQAGDDSYQYDLLGRLMREDKAAGDTLVYTRDANGAVLSLASPAGTTTYTYDGLGRIATVADATGTMTYAYDEVGNLATLAYPNGVVATHTYDSVNRLLRVANTRGATLISAYDYTVNAGGKRTRVVESGSATTGRTADYAYDAAGRLVQETITEPGGATSIAYAYDNAGNRTTMNRGGVATSYTYDSNDRVLAENTGVQAVTSAWDANGNLRSRSGASGTTLYSYDGANRLIEVSGSGGSLASYAYDADGTRVRRTAAGVTTRYVVDKAFAAMLCNCNGDVPNAASLVVAEVAPAGNVGYTHGHAILNRRSGGNTAWYLRDGAWSTRQLADAGGNVTDRYTYDAFGVTLAQSGTNANPFRYSGESLDSATGLYDLRARQYQPETGRFISTDPFMGYAESPITLHRYLYAGADPVNNRDPSGRDFTLPSLTFSQALNASFATGIITTLGTRATGIARDWGEALSMGSYASTLVLAVLVPYAAAVGNELAVARTATAAVFRDRGIYNALHLLNGVRTELQVAQRAKMLIQVENYLVTFLQNTFRSKAALCVAASSLEVILTGVIAASSGLILATPTYPVPSPLLGPAQVEEMMQLSHGVFLGVRRSFGCP
ncbi:MAG: PASTA domain-containing protein [Burkholderiales bacterium]|nr:PASTA domain-containing protein [Burkholderiales bacterium]